MALDKKPINFSHDLSVNFRRDTVCKYAVLYSWHGCRICAVVCVFAFFSYCSQEIIFSEGVHNCVCGCVR